MSISWYMYVCIHVHICTCMYVCACAYLIQDRGNPTIAKLTLCVCVYAMHTYIYLSLEKIPRATYRQLFKSQTTTF